MKPFVLVHGAWVGGWYLRDIARLLRAAGYEVFTPTLTGLGERVHLGHRAVGLDTHVQDIVNVLVYEDLWEVTLVGHSYGGMVITGVAEAVPERIGQLIYLDAFVPQNGQSLGDLVPALVPYLEGVAAQFGDGWQVPHDPPQPRKLPHPLKSLQQPLAITNPAAAQLPRTYVLFTQNSFPFAPVFAALAQNAQAEGWRYRELAVDHIAPETDPQALAALLLTLA
ncbi:MAG: alpha/beta fold hydrolase [Caldilinea sp. CFX5]|nr:alpha/beta fold hydrolase [Caldilinea sp. CFX5]